MRFQNGIHQQSTANARLGKGQCVRNKDPFVRLLHPMLNKTGMNILYVLSIKCYLHKHLSQAQYPYHFLNRHIDLAVISTTGQTILSMGVWEVI